MTNLVLIRASEVANYLKVRLVGPDLIISNIQPIAQIEEGSICFINRYSENVMNLINNHPNALVICPEEYHGKLKSSYIISTNPRLDFLRAIKCFYAKSPEIGISPTASISNQAQLGDNLYIGHNTVIDANVSIGDGCKIHDNVVIRGSTTIGKDCVIKSSAVIGEEGFGFELNEYGVPEHFPHIGGVHIGNNVFIGSCSTIERAAIAQTTIRDNVKIDDLVQIGHNCSIGENSLIMAGTITCGGVQIGRNCWIGPNSSIKEKIVVGDGALIGLGSVVIEDVNDHTVVAGNPARFIRDNRR